MDYYINPSIFSAVFPFSSEVVDKYLKLASGEQIKVLLYIMRNNGNNPSLEEISSNTDVSVYDVKEALMFWADAGLLVSNAAQTNNDTQKNIVKKVLKPQREDVAKRGLEDPKIRYMLNETQLKFGRNLKTNETSTLVWLYDDQGLDVSLILLIVQYAVTHNRANIRFIESVATDWLNKGIVSLEDADRELNNLAMGEQAWAAVQSVFGIERRKPSKKEIELSLKWINEWKISKEMLLASYEACVDAKSKFSFPYVAKIIENWHQKGYKKPEDIEAKEQNQKGFAAYDIDLFEKMLNSKD